MIQNKQTNLQLVATGAFSLTKLVHEGAAHSLGGIVMVMTMVMMIIMAILMMVACGSRWCRKVSLVSHPDRGSRGRGGRKLWRIAHWTHVLLEMSRLVVEWAVDIKLLLFLIEISSSIWVERGSLGRIKAMMNLVLA